MSIPGTRPRLALAFLAALLAFGWFGRRPWNPNENSRMAPVLAAFWQHTLAIDGYWQSGPVKTNDRSAHAGHTYSDKAPGSSLLAALGYAPLYAAERATGREAHYLIRKYVMTLAAVGVPLALGLAALFWLAMAAAGVRAAAAVLAAALLGSPLLPYGSVLFGHGLAAALLVGAYAVIRSLHGAAGPPGAGRLAAGGALLAGAVAVEYPTAPAAVVLGLLALHRLHGAGELRRPRSVLWPLAGAAPVVALVALYNWSCFGAPLSPGYAHLTVPLYRSVHAHGILGVGPPQPDVLYYLTLHPARGLFLHAPVLLLALPGLWYMARRPGWRADAVACAAVVLSFLLVNAGFGFWWGGYTYTARHLVPAVPFLLLPLAFLPRRALWLGAPLLLASAAQVLPATFGDPFTSDGRLMGQLRDAAAQGGLVPWRGTWSVGLDVWPALTRRDAAGGWPGFAPNMGLLLGLSGPASVVPFLAAVLAPLALLARGARRAGAERPARAPAEPGTPARA